MKAKPANTAIGRFGPFEFDTQTGELRKQGVRIHLEGQPLVILRMLLERPGELVSREQIRNRLWPADTFVDFEHSLNAAIKRLRRALNDSASVPRYIETLSGRGYRVIAGVRMDPPEQQETVEVPIRPRTSKKVWLLSAAAVAAVLVAASISDIRNLVLGLGSPQIHSLAVLPLENLTGDSSQEYFSDGMTDALITDLAQIGTIRVISRTSVMRYKGLRKPLPEMARELGVDGVVEGTVTRSGRRVRINSQLIHAPSDRHLWARSYERDEEDLVLLEGEVAQAIATEVRAVITPEQHRRLSKRAPTNPAAYDAYLKGRHYWNQRTPAAIRKSIEFYRQAADRDPNFAPAYAGLADAYNFSNILGALAPKDSFPAAKAAATKALQLDPDLAEAHAALGLVKSHYDFDFSAAQREFLKAIELNPNYANAHLFYAGGYFTPMGQHENAIREMKKALELDPLSPGLNNYMGMTYMLAGQDEKSREQLERTIELDPTFALAHFFLAALLDEIGNHDAAIAENERGELLLGAPPEGARAQAERFHKALRNGGPPAYWRLQLELTLKSYNRAGTDYFPAIEIAAAYARTGDKDNAFKWLQKSYEEREGQSITLVKWLPPFKSLYGDPRMDSLLEQMGLPR